MQQDKPKLWLPLAAALGLGLSVYALTLDPPPDRASAETAEQANPQPQPAKVPPDKGEGAPASLDQATRFHLRNELVDVEVVDLGAGVAHYRLRDERYRRDGEPIELVTTWRPAYLPLTLRAKGLALPPDARWTGEQLSERAVRFTWRGEGVVLRRKLELGQGPYQIWSTLTVQNLSDAPVDLQLGLQGAHWVTREEESGQHFLIPTRSYHLSSGMCGSAEETRKEDRADLVEEAVVLEGQVSFGSVENMYFTQAIAADGEPFARCTLQGVDLPHPATAEGSLLTALLEYAPAKLGPGEKRTFRSLAYVGPKVPELMAAAGHSLPEAIDVGGVAGINVIAKGLASLLSGIHEVVGNWGLAIILLTFIVKLVLYPLTAKSFESMAAMRRLKPEIDALNEKYGDDRQRKGEAMMALYKEHKINPVGGCLPALLQMPIWFALYMSLSTNVELFRQPFILYWQDLSAPDPFYVLPLGLGALMFVQQKLTPTTMDPMQAKMMLYMMPAMITVFMLFLPSGLTLYMFTNSALTIVQQKFNERRYMHVMDGQQSAAAAERAATDAGAETQPKKAKPKPRRTRRGRA